MTLTCHLTLADLPEFMLYLDWECDFIVTYSYESPSLTIRVSRASAIALKLVFPSVLHRDLALDDISNVLCHCVVLNV